MPQTTSTNLRWEREIVNTTLVVAGICIGVIFTVGSSLATVFPVNNRAKAVIFHTGDVLSGNLPQVLYLLGFLTALLMICTGTIVVLLWPSPFRALVLSMMFFIDCIYYLWMNCITAKFLIKIGTCNISNAGLAGLLAAAFICSAAALYYTGKYALLNLIRFAGRYFLFILGFALATSKATMSRLRSEVVKVNGTWV